MKVGARPKQASFYLLAAFFAGPLDLAGAAWAVQRLPADVADSILVIARRRASSGRWRRRGATNGVSFAARGCRVCSLCVFAAEIGALYPLAADKFSGSAVSVLAFCFGFLFWRSVMASRAAKTVSFSGAQLPNRVGILQFANMDAAKAWQGGGGSDIQEKISSKYADFRVYAIEGVEQK